MTLRIRLYLYGASARHLAMGTALIFLPNLFNADVYAELFMVAPRWLWVLTLLCGTFHLAFAAKRRSERQARIALIASSTLSLMWGVTFALIVGDGLPALTATILFFDLCYKDLVICAGSLKDPMAPALRAYQQEGEHNGS